MSTYEPQTLHDGSPQVPPHLQSENLTARLLKQKVWRPANRENDWCMFVIVGQEGSGKSLTCSSILEKCDHRFTPDSVHWEPESMLRQITELDPEERTGRAIMLDEAGVGMGVRSWYDSDQILLNKLLQTARDDNMIIGLTLPRLSELDSQTRGRLHGFLEMREVEPGDHAIFSWKNVSVTRDEKDNIYKKYPRMRRYGANRRIRRFAIGPPSDEYIEEYERQKERFKKELYEETVQELGDEEEEEDTSDPRYIAEDILEKGAEPFIGSNHGQRYIDKDLIMLEYDVGRQKAKQAKKLIQRDDDVEVDA